MKQRFRVYRRSNRGRFWLPKSGPLFPKLSQYTSSNRAPRFAKAFQRRGVVGGSLHSYRYSWAERAKTSGYPERYAQEALGHKSKAVHRAYAKMARVELPPLEEYEKKRSVERVILVPIQNTTQINCSVIRIFSPRWLTSFSPVTLQLRCTHIAGRYDGF